MTSRARSTARGKSADSATAAECTKSTRTAETAASPRGKSPNHEALLAYAGRRSATSLAEEFDVPVRSVRGWLDGRVPIWRHRYKLRDLLGLGLLKWRTYTLGGS